MEYLDAYEKFYEGKRCAILGGSESLPQEFWQCPRDCVLIGINHHAMILPDLKYIVYQDNFAHKITAIHPAQKITPLTTGENIIYCGNAPACMYSGVLAIWIASFMGFSEIYLAGFDCYSRERIYWYQISDEKKPIWTIEQNLVQYKRIKELLPGSGKIISFDKNLNAVFNG